MYLLSWEQYVYICKLYQTLKDCDYVIDSMGLNWCKVIVQVYCLTWSARDWRSENTIYGDHSINCLCRWKGRDRETSDVSLAPLPEKGVSGRSLVTPSSPEEGKGGKRRKTDPQYIKLYTKKDNSNTAHHLDCDGTRRRTWILFGLYIFTTHLVIHSSCALCGGTPVIEIR